MRFRRFAILALLLVGVLLGAAREFLFLNLNYQIDHKAHGRPFSYAHSLFQAWTAGMDLASLVRLKWVLAMVFIAAMWSLATIMARVMVGDHRYLRLIAALFLSAAGLALVLHLTGMPALEAVSIKLLHALQYPVVLLVVGVALRLQRRPQG